MSNLEMRRGDLKPDLVVELDDRGVPLPLTSATTIYVIGQRNGVLLFKRSVAPVADGLVRMEWETTDTATPGTIVVEVEVVWPGTKPQTIRSDDVVRVLPDLG